jgi:hypothetical protein
MTSRSGFDRAPVVGNVPASGEPEAPVPIGPAPALHDLSAESRARLVHFIVTSTLGGGVAPTAVMGLYADLAGDEQAVRYADQRFILREVPAGWREVENRVVDLAEAARQRGLDLAAAWQRAVSVAISAEDPLEQLARLVGARGGTSQPRRSIFDDPEDFDALEYEAEESRRGALADRPPDLLDLEVEAQDKIRRFAVEERLERGLAPIELLELYRAFEVLGDDRARQYLDRVFVERQPPPDWLELQAEAQRILDLADSRGRDAGRVYADILRASPGIDPLAALRAAAERLRLR